MTTGSMPGVAGLLAVLAAHGCGATLPPADDCLAPSLTSEPATPAQRATFDYPRAAPLDLAIGPGSPEGALTRYPFTFASPGGGRVPGYLLVPDGPGPFPAIIVQHGLPGTAAGVLGDAVLFAGHGAVVAAIDAPFSRRAGEPVRLTVEDSVEQVQLIVDLRRLVDLLAARPDVDPARIGYRGWSYGAAMGGLLAGVEPRLRTAILTVGDGGLVSHFASPGEPGPLDAIPCSAGVRWRLAMIPIEPLRYIGFAAPMPLLLQSGRLDNLVPPAHAEAFHRAAGEPKTVRWYDAGHGLNAQAMEDQLAWFHDHLGTRR